MTQTAVLPKIIEIDIEGEPYRIELTMLSFATYERLRGNSLMVDLPLIVNFQHESLLYAMGAMLYPIDGDKPVGEQIHEMNPVGLMLSPNMREAVTNVLLANLPTVSDSKKNKKKD